MERVLLGAGPHESYIIMCSCGAIEVTREPTQWRRFTPYHHLVRCYCDECGEINSMEVLEENLAGSDRKSVLQALNAVPSMTIPAPAIAPRDNVVVAFPRVSREAEVPD